MKKLLLKSIFLSITVSVLCSFNIYGVSKYQKNDTITLQNDFLIVKIKKKGAEIISLFNKKNSFEHIWQADKKTWNQSAPILFPIVGKLKNGNYKIDNKEYKMKNHGFASKSHFEIVTISKKQVVFMIKSNEFTLKKYPYKFKLLVKYSLKKNKIKIEKRVENIDDKKIYFSIGAHPGFNIPLKSNEKYADYYLEFCQNETVSRLPLTKKKGLLSNTPINKYLDNSNKLQLNHKMFKDRAIILEGLKSSSVKIKSKNSNFYIKIGIKNIPFLGIWSTSKSNENFVCIEPWYGLSDNVNSTGNFKNKKGIQSLEVAKKFTMKYYIEIENNK